MIMNAIIAISIGGVAGCLLGVLVGWLLRGKEEVTVEKVVTKTVEKVIEKLPEDLLAQRDQAAAVLSQLELLALGVSAEISAHSATVGNINSELTSSDDSGTGETVVSAIKRLIESNNSMQAKLETAQSELQVQAQQLKKEQETARTDQLTKLSNRRAFDDEVQKCKAEFEKSGKILALMMIDVDHFKKFNDTHGHQAGDEVLRSVGRVLSEKTFGKEGLVPARYGGEEFAVIFSGNTLEAVTQIGDRIRSAICASPVIFENKKLQVQASAGIAAILPGETITAFIARADEALYASKKAGRNCTHVNKNGEMVKVEKTEREDATLDFPAPVPGEDIVLSVGRRIAEWKRGGTPISVIVARVDNLAQIEATWGAEGLERVKVAVQAFCQNSLREMDLVTPWLGDMYGMMLPTAKLVDAARSAERMRLGLEQGELDSVVGSHLSLSFGVAEVSIDDDGEGLLLRARRAVEQARRKGGNVVYIHDGRQTDPALDRLDLAGIKWVAQV
jgi:diguanylate cyclase